MQKQRNCHADVGRQIYERNKMFGDKRQIIGNFVQHFSKEFAYLFCPTIYSNFCLLRPEMVNFVWVIGHSKSWAFQKLGFYFFSEIYKSRNYYDIRKKRQSHN